MNKNTMKIVSNVLIIVLSAVAIGLIVLMALGIMGNKNPSNGFMNNGTSLFSEPALVNEVETDAAGIKEIDVRYGFERTDIFYGNSDKIVLKEYMNFEPTPDQLATVSNRNGSLEISAGSRNFIPSMCNIRVEIYLPSTYKDAFEVSTSSGSIHSDESLGFSEFEATSSSGSQQYDSISAKSVKISSSSGSQRISEITADEVSVSTTSGSQRFESIESETVNLSSSSGSIRCGSISGSGEIHAMSGSIDIESADGNLNISQSSGSLKAGKIDGDLTVEHSSGSITVEDCTGFQDITATSGTIRTSGGIGGNFKSSSGSITVNLDSVDADVDIGATSGFVKLTVPAESAFDFKASSNTGYISTDFDNKLSTSTDELKKAEYGENPQHQVEISTSSGSITVKLG